MKFMDINLEEEPLSALMEKALANTGFHSIRVFTIDYLNHKLTQKHSLQKKGEPAVSYSPPAKTFEMLKRIKKALILDKDFEWNEKYEKYDPGNKCEVYIPLHKELDNKDYYYGLILLALDSNDHRKLKVLEDKGFLELIKKISSKLSIKDDIARRKESMYEITYLLCEIIDGKEPYLISRLFNVAYWGIKIAKHMGVSQEDIEKLQIAVLMHDLGKIYIDESILNKKGKLTKEEYEIIKKRVVYSYEIAQKLNQLYVIGDLPDIILNCQERIDGKGYPEGKYGDEIPFLSKILGAAKAISSMLTNTSYRRAKTIPEVISELKQNANKQFDEQVVNAAVALLLDEGREYQDCLSSIGTYATLSIKLKANKADMDTPEDILEALMSDETDELSAEKDNDNAKAINEDLNIWGTVRKIDDIYVFTPTKKTVHLETARIKSCKLYINIDERIYRYIPEIEEVSGEKIVFSEIRMVDEPDAFAIRWLLDGYFVSTSRNAYNIFVTMVGGDFVDFYIFSDEIKENITQGVIRIDFDDGKKSTLPGMIVFSEKIGDKTYFRLKFTGVETAERRLIYAEIFRKQVKIKSLLREGRY
ncbi:MAG: HD-GYP domain-containing protein [Bacillota bacterium]